ncbi:hypothetical protein [Terrabacter terrae]|uniref:hypothetical protein n=1 Tax=Terrabacter terrae TaxID=318434 RepID=UPI0031E0A461
MPVSSLVFVVIVAIWAAYLIQHWARRREDAAATRSMEGFSEAMRVLEKRPALPTTQLSTPRPHSYAVKPASGARPTVDVKRAVPAGASRRSSPLVARRALVHVEHDLARHDIAPYAEVDRMPQTARSTNGRAGTGRAGSASAASAPAPVPVAQRRLRAALLVLALLWLPVSVVLTLTHVLMWVSVPFAVLTVAAVLVWLRAEAKADRLRSTSGADTQSYSESYSESYAQDEAPRRRRRQGRGRRDDSVLVPVLSSEDTQVIRSTVVAVEAETVSVSHGSRHAAAAQHAAHQAAARAEKGVFDVQAHVTRGVPVAAPTPAAAPAPEPAPGSVPAPAAQQLPEGSWSPVPVPRPTYALKAKAEPRWTDSGIPADVFDTPEFAEEADELDDRALFARRAVSQ